MILKTIEVSRLKYTDQNVTLMKTLDCGHF
jgi:hypothetical protein